MLRSIRRETISIFVNAPSIDRHTGLSSRTTIDKSRGLEFTVIRTMYDDLYFVLNVGGREILGVAKYKTSNENTVIHLFVTRVGLSLPPKYEGCLFSSRKEMVEIGAYIEEALKVSGLNHKLSSQQTVEVGFSEKAFPFKDGAQ